MFFNLILVIIFIMNLHNSTFSQYLKNIQNIITKEKDTQKWELNTPAFIYFSQYLI